MSEYYVSSVMLTGEAIEVTFMVLPDDVRSEASLIATRSYTIARDHPRFGPQVRELVDDLTDLTEDVHRGFADEPITTGEEDDDEPGGMGE